jgi:addiction module RelE/StbE family toxin
MEIEWTNRALADLDGVWDFIAKDDRRAAADTVDRIIITVEEHLPREPEIGRPGRVDGTRELILPHSSYIVPYRVRHSRIDILAVLHGAQQWPDTF